MYGKVGCSDIAQELGSIICPILSGRCRLHNCTSPGQVVGGIGCPAVTDRCTIRWGVLI